MFAIFLLNFVLGGDGDRLDRVAVWAFTNPNPQPKPAKSKAKSHSVSPPRVPAAGEARRPGRDRLAFEPAAAEFPAPVDLGLRRLRAEFGLEPVEYPTTRAPGLARGAGG